MSILEQPCISHRGLRKACRYLPLFVELYFPFYGLTLADFFEYAPTLTFIEATIYQLDHFLESSQRKREVAQLAAFEAVRARLSELLRALDCHDELMAFELGEMVAYCELETHLMCSGATPTAAELRRAAELRTIDLRLLHRALVRLRGEQDDPQLFALFRPVEALWDIEVDFVEYADDVREDSFNMFRMYVRAYGEDAPARVAADIAALEREVLASLATLPPETAALARELYARYRDLHPRPPIPTPIPDPAAPSASAVA